MRYSRVLLPLSLLGISVLGWANDPLERLIEKEQKVDPQWILSDQDLPPVYLLGDSNSILIYSPEMEDDASPSLCSHVSWEELTDETQKYAFGGDYKINFLSPTIRDRWANMCLVRPGDQVMAIGRGQQQRVTIDSFVLRPHVSPCEDHVGMEIRALLKDPLPPDPLFYSSDPALVEGDNQYHSMATSTQPVPIAVWKQALDKKVEFFSDFTVDFLTDDVTGSTTAFAVAHLKRETISTDDVGLSHEMAAVLNGSQVQILIKEKIYKDQQTGRIDSIDVFDFNRDGLMDIVMEGDHAGCFFRKIFVASVDEYSDKDFPHIDCQCQ